MGVSRDPPTILAITLAIAIGVTVLWAASTSIPAFGIYNPGWDGASELREEADAVDSTTLVATSVVDYNKASPNDTVAVILSPDRSYSDTEAARLRQFVLEGGTLVVAEDFGNHTNSLLLRVGASVRIDGDPVRDEQNYYRSPNLPLATGVTDSELTTEVDQLTLNHGTVLRPNRARVVVESSPFAYVDTNRNQSLERAESMQQYPVVTAEQVGNGRIIAISDPSIFINSMNERSGNQRFTRNLLSQRSTVLLDYSHTDSIPPLAQARLTLQQSPSVVGLAGLILLGFIIILGSQLRAFELYRQSPTERVPPPSSNDLRSRVSDRHPEWDTEKINRVIEAIITGPNKGNEDD